MQPSDIDIAIKQKAAFARAASSSPPRRKLRIYCPREDICLADLLEAEAIIEARNATWH